MELKLSNGDTVYFVEKLKGKHYREMRKISLEVQVESGNSNKKIDKMKFDAASYIESQIRMFTVFAEKIVTKDGVEVEPTMDYYDELDIQDAKKIDEVVEKIIEDNEKEDKKK